MKFYRVLAVIISLLFMLNLVTASSIEVEDTYDFKLAFDYAFSNNIDTLILVTSGGVYTTTDTVFFQIKKPLTIIAKEGLAEKPIITHSDPDSSVLEIIRIHDDFTVEGVIFDGGHAVSHGMKYALRVGPDLNENPPKTGLNVRVKDCEFRDIFEDKDLSKDGHALYFLLGVDAGSVVVENSTFQNIGYEAIRMSETEKYPIDRCLDTLIVRNCTFVNIDNECVRFYADLDENTEDAYVLLEHITINNSATRSFYIKNNQNTILRDVIVTDSRLDGRGDRSDYVIEIQQTGSVVSHVDTFNIVFDPVSKKEETIRSTKGGAVDTLTIYGFDPLFTDPANFDFTLPETSPAYGKGHDGSALGDLRWATNPPTGITEKQTLKLPSQFELQQNFPNPFNPVTHIRYSLNKPATVRLQVFDITGALVEILVDGQKGAGNYLLQWQPENLASGIYFYSLQVDGQLLSTRKMVLMR